MSTTLVSLCLVAFCFQYCSPQYAPYPYQYPYPYPYPFQPFPGYQNPYQYRYPPYPLQNGYPRQPIMPYLPTEIIDVPDVPMVNDTFPGLPTEIIDIDPNEIVPEISTEEPTLSSTVTTTGASTISPYISGTSIQHYSSNLNNTKGIHIYESKPINTVIRRTIHSNGKDGRNVLNIHVVNGVEITSLETPIITYDEAVTTEHTNVVSTTEEEESEEDEEQGNNKDDDADPKPILGWFN